MASTRDENDPGSRHVEEPNPFVAFRRFADEQVASLWHNILGFPLSFQSSTTAQSRFGNENRQRELEEQRQRTREETKEQCRAVDALVKARYERTIMVDENDKWYSDTDIGSSTHSGPEQEVMRCPYRPGDQEIPLRNRAPQSSPNTHFHVTTQPKSGTIFGYLLRSPYSPLRLEQEFALRNHPMKWRRAFEDLTGVPIEGELRDLEKFERGWCGYWEKIVESLQSYESNPAPREMVGAPNYGNDGRDEVTELDVYEHFLGSQYPQATTLPSTSAPASDAKSSTVQSMATATLAATPTSPPSITSTLTTTERNTFPDGSVHTKVVLKKRFADGREESTETEHTSYGGQGSAKPSTVSEAKDAPKSEASEGIAQQAQKKGWFWS